MDQNEDFSTNFGIDLDTEFYWKLFIGLKDETGVDRRPGMNSLH
jgi:uncharacterized protein YciU (UPF0263 family)